VEKPTASSLNWIYPIVSLAALVIFGVGLYLVLLNPHEWTMLAAGCVSLVAIGVTWPIAYSLRSSCVVQTDTQQLSQRLNERVEQMATLMSRIGESQLLSDRAKSVAFREKDRDAIRRAIHEEMERQEWEAAHALADQFEQAFGSKTEADRFRSEINDKRQEGTRKQIAEVVSVIERHTRAEQWSAAVREAEKLRERFPDNDQVRALPKEIEGRRQSHKKQLLQSWHEAVARHDVDGSIEILKQLDTYLTPAEADSMQDAARGVFKEKLNNIGAQFAAAIREHKWAEALKLGEQIQGEFPNSRAAQEVREKMDMLRQRAGDTASAPA
jgi:hypothetical protein